MNKKFIVLLFFATVLSITAAAQGHKGLRITEVMVQNDSNYVDDYGKCSAWIELCNTSRRPMQISSVYITTSRTPQGEKLDATRTYLVPRGDHRTVIEPLQQAVFFADNAAGKGTFHTNLSLVPGEVNYVALYDADGLTKLDEVEIPVLGSNFSFARKTTVENYNKIESFDFVAQDWEVRSGTEESIVTPGTNNYVIGANSKVAKFRETDPHGFILTIMAMCIVFSALLLLSISFWLFGRVNERLDKRNKAVAHSDESKVLKSTDVEADSGEAIAAIGFALYQHLNAHDVESTVLTINKVKRAYSPWSSKIYTLREVPTRK